MVRTGVGIDYANHFFCRIVMKLDLAVKEINFYKILETELSCVEYPLELTIMPYVIYQTE
jgi:hypothetical protein